MWREQSDSQARQISEYGEKMAMGQRILEDRVAAIREREDVLAQLRECVSAAESGREDLVPPRRERAGPAAAEQQGAAAMNFVVNRS